MIWKPSVAMPTAFADLYDSMQLQLTEAQPANSLDLDAFAACFAICNSICSEVRQLMIVNGFPDDDAEILYFKHIKPLFYSHLIYYHAIYQLLLSRPVGTGEDVMLFSQHAQSALQGFFQTHLAFFQYYRTKDTLMDTHYFLRRTTKNILALPMRPEGESGYSTGYDDLAAMLIAYEKVLEYIPALVTSQPLGVKDTQVEEPTLQWTGPVIYLVEVIYGLIAMRIINNGQVPARVMARIFSKLFHVNLDGFAKKLEEIRLRKKRRIVALEIMTSSLIRLMEEEDNMKRT